MEKLSQIFETVAFDGIVPTCKALFGHGERYIKVDGSKFHSKPLKSFFEKAAFKAYAVTAAAVVGGDFLLNRQYDGDPTILAMCLTSGLLGIYQTKTTDNIALSSSLFCCKAIDTEGRDIKRKALSLFDIYYLESRKNSRINLSLVYSTVAILGCTLVKDASLLIMTSPYIAAALNDGHIAHMLLKGHASDLEFQDNADTPNIKTRKKENGYVICDEPPAKTAKEKKTRLSFGGLTTTAP